MTHLDPTIGPLLTHNTGDTRRVRSVDINGDGRNDIVVSGFGAVTSEFSSLIYLNETASFRAFNPTVITDHPFAFVSGLEVLPVDVDGVGKLDCFVSSPLNALSNPGAIGVFLGL